MLECVIMEHFCHCGKFCWAALGQACLREESHSAEDLPETVAHYPEKKERQSSRRRREFERGFTCLSNVAQQQTGEPLGQRTPKGSSGLGSFIATRIALLMASRC